MPQPTQAEPSEVRGANEPIEPIIRGRLFSDSSPTIRGLLVLLFTLCLALFLHMREEGIEVLAVGSPSPRFLVAQTDFSYLDKESTRAARHEALAPFGPVLQVDEKQLLDRRDLINQQIADPEGPWGELGHSGSLLDANRELERRIGELRFADPQTSALLSKQPWWDQQTIPLQEATEISRDQVLETAQSAQLPITAEESERLAQLYADPPLELLADPSANRKVREEVLAAVPARTLQVRAGSRILDKGEIVTTRHAAMAKAMQEALGTNRELWEPLPALGSLLLASLIVGLGAIYFLRRQPEVCRSAQKLALYFTVILLALALSKGMELLALSQATGVAAFANDITAYPCVIPFAVIILGVLVAPELALFSGVFLSVLLALTIAVDVPRFLVLNLIASLVGCLSSRSLRRRKDVFLVAFKTWAVCVPYLWSLQLSQNAAWSRGFLIDVAGTALSLMTTAILVVGILPLLETVFNLLTDITLMEFMDPNNELLRRLTIEAPGTYQHSLIVANLAESAASAIGANGLFCRVATLYHDIGKLIGPHYFTENQQGGVNIHQLLTPIESAQVIIAHVTEGYLMGKRHGLPEAFLDIIREHHGNTLVYYFFCKQLELAGSSSHLVYEGNFRYPGPKPRSKESAIIMIADCLEAASRSLEDFNEGALQDLLDRIVHDKAEDGQFDHCSLTFEELGIVKRAMIKTLLISTHARIKYPRRFS
jgi:putative nucleotidyltransferase with HDIG domain